MNSISKLLVNRYWFRLLLSICLSVTATLFGVNGNFFWMGLSIGALVISIWWQLRLYRHHTRQVLFMIDALENNDNAFHFPEDIPFTSLRNTVLRKAGRSIRHSTGWDTFYTM